MTANKTAGKSPEVPVTTALSEVLPQGRYIPYSGGSMGWFENQGVLKSERKNGYRFYSVMESEYVRAALFQRWSMVTDNRRGKRIEKENSINVMMSDSGVAETAYRLNTDSGVIEGKTRDVSLYGMRMTFSRRVKLSVGDAIKVSLLGSEDGEPLIEIPAQVVWLQEAEVVRPVWFVGVAFAELTTATESFLADFVGHD